MASGPKRQVVQPDPQGAMPSFDAVVDSASWESRLAKARARRQEVLAARDEPASGGNHVDGDAISAASRGSAGSGDPNHQNGDTVLSLEDVLETRNLKERLELAQRRHAQLKENSVANAPVPEPLFADKSAADFKKVVLHALTDGSKVEAAAKLAPKIDTARLALLVTPPSVTNRDTGPDQGRKKPLILVASLAVTAALLTAAFMFAPGLFAPADLPGDLLPGRGSSVASQTTPVPTPAMTPVPSFVTYQPNVLASPTQPDQIAVAIASVSTVRSAPGIVAPQKPDYVGGVGQVARQTTPVPTLARAPVPSFVTYQPNALASPTQPDQIAVAIAPVSTVRSAPGILPPQKLDYVGGVGQAVNLAALFGLALGPENITTEVVANLTAARPGNAPIVPISGENTLADLNNQAILTDRPNLTTALFVPATFSTTGPAFEPFPVEGGVVNLLLDVSATVMPTIWESSTPVGKPSPGFRAPAHLPPVTLARAPEIGAVTLPARGAAPAPMPLASFDTTPLARPTKNLADGLPEHSIRVFAPSSVAETVTTEIVAQITGAGFDVGSFRPVGFSISSNNVRYYHSRDAETATALAAMINAKARDFTSFSPRPPVGVVELWLAGSAPKTATRRSSASSDAALQALRDRLVQRMQRGDHLGGG